jgi:hypothetical protein
MLKMRKQDPDASFTSLHDVPRIVHVVVMAAIYERRPFLLDDFISTFTKTLYGS